MDECFVQLPILGAVSASKTKQSRFFREIAAHLPGARKDGLGKEDSPINRNLTPRFTYLSRHNSVIVTKIAARDWSAQISIFGRPLYHFDDPTRNFISLH
jgi:hypothetical protein